MRPYILDSHTTSMAPRVPVAAMSYPVLINGNTSRWKPRHPAGREDEASGAPLTREANRAAHLAATAPTAERVGTRRGNRCTVTMCYFILT